MLMATVQGDNVQGDDPQEENPPLLDVSDRPAATPGPLTKPSPTIRPPQRPRWKILIAAVVILAAAVAAIVFLPLLFS